jgi:hypothetical protein
LTTYHSIILISMSLSSSSSDIDDANFASTKTSTTAAKDNVVPYRSPEMTKDTIPSGMDLLLGGSCVTTPATVALWANHTHQVIVHTTFGSLLLQSWPDGAYHYGQHALAMPIVVWMRSMRSFNEVSTEYPYLFIKGHYDCSTREF